MTNGWIDIKNTDMMLIMGGNPAENHPCGFKWPIEAKRRRNAKMIVVDPRFTRTAATADLFLQIRGGGGARSEEHTSELQSPYDIVCRLLLEKKITHVFFCVSKNVSVSYASTQGKREQVSGFNRTLDAINNVFRKFSAFHVETGRLNVDGMNIISNDGSNKVNRSRKARVSYKVQPTINASLIFFTITRAVRSYTLFPYTTLFR